MHVAMLCIMASLFDYCSSHQTDRMAVHHIMYLQHVLMQARTHYMSCVWVVLRFDEFGRAERDDLREHLESYMLVLFAHDQHKSKYHVGMVSNQWAQ